MPITRRKFITTGLITAAGIAVTDAFWIEKFFIETNEFYLGTATRETDNLRLIQVSDLHLQKISYPIRQLAKKINGLQPDLIVFTGDAIDKAENLPLFNEFLGLINTNIAKAAIPGNWEYWGKVDLAALAEVYQTHNGTLLINQSIQYHFNTTTLSVTGVDDLVGGKADISTALQHYQVSDHHIILNHCPQYTEQIRALLPKEITTACILSGHTHGGQVNLFGFAPFLPPGSGKYVKGWYEDADPKLYVSKGIGTSVFPVRFGSRAEMAVFFLKNVSSNNTK